MHRPNLFDPNNLEVAQGNTKEIDITPIDKDTGEPIVLTEGDIVLFTVVNARGEKVIQKRLTYLDYSDPDDKSINCTLEADDTIHLPTGWYSYDCFALLAGGKYVTFVQSSLIITESYGKYTDLTPSPEPEPETDPENSQEIQNEPIGGDDDG